MGVHYGLANDAEALDAFQTLCRTEGILPALESSHALAWVLRHHGELPAGGHVVVNLSGRGDKDIFTVSRILEEKGLFTDGRLDVNAARKLTDSEGGRHD